MPDSSTEFFDRLVDLRLGTMLNRNNGQAMLCQQKFSNSQMIDPDPLKCSGGVLSNSGLAVTPFGGHESSTLACKRTTELEA